MRTAAEIDEIAFAVERDFLVGGMAPISSLVLLAHVEEELDGIVTPDFASNRNVALQVRSPMRFRSPPDLPA